MNGFTFQNPWLLSSLVLIPLLILLHSYARKKRLNLLTIYGGNDREQIVRKQIERNQNEWCNIIGISLLIFALARPGANPHPASSPEGGRDLIFVLDVSRSMLANDQRPNRLSQAKADIERCLDSLNRDRVGLIVFAGSASLQSPLTSDDTFLRTRLKEVSPESVAKGSTYLQIVLEKTIDLMLTKDRIGFQDIILLTDGEDQGSHPEKTVSRINTSKTRLMIVGYGEPKIGSRIPLGENGLEGFLVDQGKEIWTRLQEDQLKTLAQIAEEGLYVHADKPGFDLGKTYLSWSEKAPKSPLNGSPVTIYDEYFYLFLIPALFLFTFQNLPLRRNINFSKKFALFLFLGITVQSGHADETEPQSPEVLAMQKSIQEETNDLIREEKKIKLAIYFSKNKQPNEATKVFQEAEENATQPERLAKILYFWALHEALQGESAPDPSVKIEFLNGAIKKAKKSLLLYPKSVSSAQLLEVLYEKMHLNEKALEEQKKKKEDLDKNQENILKELKRLLILQQKLHNDGLSLQRNKQTPIEQKLEILKNQNQIQQKIEEETILVHQQILSLQSSIQEILRITSDTPQTSPPASETRTPFDEPLLHVGNATQSQKKAVELLGPLDLLGQGVLSEHQAAVSLETAIKLLDSPSTKPQSPSENSEEESDSDESEMSPSDESNATESSLAMKGESRTDMVNRSLPKPNFSAEQILQEEQQNASTRAKNKPARIEKGEKDW